jgi:ABC-type lipoprotein release transport system permease subunit
MVPTVAPQPVVSVLQQAGSYHVTWLQRAPHPLRDALRRWRGMLATVVGVGIALGIVMTLSALGRSLILAYTTDFLTSGANRYIAAEGGKVVQVLPSDNPGTLSQARGLLAQVRRLPGVAGALGVMHWTMQRTHEGRHRPDEPTELVAVVGIDGDPALVPSTLALREGRWLRRQEEIVVGWRVNREKGWGVGDTVRLNHHDFLVVGIGKLRGVGFIANAVVYLDHRALQQYGDIGDLANAIVVATAEPAAVDAWAADQDSLTTYTPADLVRQAEHAMEGELVNYQIFNALALFAAALFVTSMLGRSVAGRRNEFATLRAIGVPQGMILLMVGVEAMVVSLLAGLFGIVFSAIFGATVLNGYVAPRFGLDFVYAADASTFLQAMVVAFGLGLVAAVVPARQAVRVDPVDVLREM